MRILTERFGEIEVEETSILYLKNGLIGLPECKKVLLIEHKPNSPFRWLQSVEDPGLALPVVDPFLLVKDYPMDEIRSALESDGKKPNEIAVAAIATVPPPPRAITVNLLAPVAFDAIARQGDQIVLHDDRFTIRHVLSAQQEACEQG